MIIMPRRASLKEHLYKHQLATAERFVEMGKVMVAMDERERPKWLNEVQHQHCSGVPISHHASSALLETVRKFLFQEESGVRRQLVIHGSTDTKSVGTVEAASVRHVDIVGRRSVSNTVSIWCVGQHDARAGSPG
jgi:hypothetical protein